MTVEGALGVLVLRPEDLDFFWKFLIERRENASLYDTEPKTELFIFPTIYTTKQPIKLQI